MMSHWSLRGTALRRLVTAGLTVAAAASVVPGEARAASVQVELKCNFPGIGIYRRQPVKLKVAGDFPTSQGAAIPAVPLTVTLVSPFTGIFPFLPDRTTRISGSFKLGMKIGTDEQAMPVEVPGTFAGDLPAGGIYGAYTLAGPATSPTTPAGSQPINYDLAAFSANLKYFDRTGQVLSYPPITDDVDLNPTTDSDGDPTTYDVSCKIDPPTQNQRLVSVSPSSPVGPVGDLVLHRAKDGMQLCWGPAANAASYRVTLSGPASTENYTVTNATCIRFRNLVMNQPYQVSVKAIGELGDASPPGTSGFVLDVTVIDQFPPTAPADLKAIPGSAGVALSWTASTDPSGIDGYDIYVDGEYAKTVTSTSTVVAGLPPATHTFGVRARDTWDNGATSDVVSVFTGPVCSAPPALPLAPLKPVAVPAQAGDVTSTTIRLRWAAGVPAPCGISVPVDSYRITFGGGTTIPVRGTVTDQVITGLKDSTEYAFQIVAVDAAGNASEPLGVTASTTPIIDDLDRTTNFGLAGSVVLKNLLKGTAAVTGSSTLNYEATDHSITGDLKLNDVTARLVSGGFLPLTAKLGFISSGATTGSLVGGSLKTTSKVRIKVLQLRVFGAIPLAIGNTCQTKAFSTIALASTTPFSFDTGGTLAGTFAMSDLNGCGTLQGLVSPLTAGGGNTINLNLTPKA